VGRAQVPERAVPVVVAQAGLRQIALDLALAPHDALVAAVPPQALGELELLVHRTGADREPAEQAPGCRELAIARPARAAAGRGAVVGLGLGDPLAMVERGADPPTLDRPHGGGQRIGFGS
jgi:hypothetical protein